MANPRPRQRRQLAADQQTPQASVTSRALALLGAFESGGASLSLTALARHAELPMATAHRLVSELLAWGALERDGSNYVIGRRIWRLGTLAPVQQNITDIASPYMHDVLFVTHNVVNLFIQDAGEALLVERISGTRAGDPFRRVGDRLPLHASAAGKIILAFGGDAVPAMTRKLERLTPHTVTDTTALERELAEVRNRGYATSHQEAGLDNYALAVPVMRTAGGLAAALGVVSQGQTPRVGSVVPVLRIAARGISRGLTGVSSP